ncbi:MAG: hypothetical protein KDD82_17450 [Planctomycetes bacterium]|nr:hypothetical protein [Planctomycetota bacterium]
MQAHRSAAHRRWILLGTLLGVVALSLTAAGCGKSGRRVANGSDVANMSVLNNASVGLDVFVDSDRLGTVPPGQLNSFRVYGNTRSLYLREQGGDLFYFGTYEFYDDRLLRIDYTPGLRNLTVNNDSQFTVHVIIDSLEIAQVQPLTSEILVVSPGLHDVYFRERGSSSADFVGLIDFPPAALSGGVVLTHGP